MTKTTKYRLFKKIFNHWPPKNNKIEKMLKRTPINQHYPSRNSYNCCCIKQSEVSSRIIFLLRISSFQSLFFGTRIFVGMPCSNSLSAIKPLNSLPFISLSKHRYTFLIFGLSFSIWSRTLLPIPQQAA